MTQDDEKVWSEKFKRTRHWLKEKHWPDGEKSLDRLLTGLQIRTLLHKVSEDSTIAKPEVLLLQNGDLGFSQSPSGDWRLIFIPSDPKELYSYVIVNGAIIKGASKEACIESLLEKLTNTSTRKRLAR